jgi:hypothetical protein
MPLLTQINQNYGCKKMLKNKKSAKKKSNHSIARKIAAPKKSGVKKNSTPSIPQLPKGRVATAEGWMRLLKNVSNFH